HSRRNDGGAGLRPSGGNGRFALSAAQGRHPFTSRARDGPRAQYVCPPVRGCGPTSSRTRPITHFTHEGSSPHAFSWRPENLSEIGRRTLSATRECGLATSASFQLGRAVRAPPRVAANLHA